MTDSMEPFHPHRPFFSTRYITLGEADCPKGRDDAARKASGRKMEGVIPPPALRETLSRCGLGLPSSVQAWAKSAKARPRLAGYDDAAVHPDWCNSISEGSEGE